MAPPRPPGLWERGSSETLLIIIIMITFSIIALIIILLIIIFDIVLCHWSYYHIIDCHLCQQDHRLQWPQNTTFTGSISLTIKLEEILSLDPVNYFITITTKYRCFLPMRVLDFSLKFQQDGYTTPAVIPHTALTRWYCINNKYFLNWVFQLFRDTEQQCC